MKSFRADMHIHSVLSPCADLEMSPKNIISAAKAKGLSMIGITDHNSTRQCSVIKELGAQAGIAVLTGAEVTTREEVHCLVYVEEIQQLNFLQTFLEAHLPPVPNNPRQFGYQVVVDASDNIIYTEPTLLISALDIGMDELIASLKPLNGIIIPAHFDRRRFGILGQLGFIPHGLEVDALEWSANGNIHELKTRHPEINDYPLVCSSDAHTPDTIGRAFICLEMADSSFYELKHALSNTCGRKCTMVH